MPASRHTQTALLTSVLLLSFFLGCDDSTGVQVDESEPETQLPAPIVSLPDPPPSAGFQVAEAHADGALRVEGLIHHQLNHLDKEVSVRGLVVSISPKCDPKKAKKNKTTCPEPNLFIKDGAEESATIRIVGFQSDFEKKLKVEVGQTHVFKGKYKKVAAGFVATEDGLILADFVDDAPVIPPR
jgi:hypothetical protein